jgi:hypothetical protein
VAVLSGTQFDGGVTIRATISRGRGEISFGGTATTLIGRGGTQEVSLSGVPPSTSILSVGTEFVPGINISGGVDTLVADFGVMDSTTGALIMAGAVSGFVVSSGVTLAILGCAISDITVLGGGTRELLVGARQSGTKVSSSGILEIGSPKIVERVSRLVHVDASVPSWSRSARGSYTKVPYLISLKSLSYRALIVCRCDAPTGRSCPFPSSSSRKDALARRAKVLVR